MQFIFQGVTCDIVLGRYLEILHILLPLRKKSVRLLGDGSFEAFSLKSF